MKKLLCESIVYCDCLLIILLIVGVLIDNKAFVCLFVIAMKLYLQNDNNCHKQHKFVYSFLYHA